MHQHTQIYTITTSIQTTTTHHIFNNLISAKLLCAKLLEVLDNVRVLALERDIRNVGSVHHSSRVTGGHDLRVLEMAIARAAR